MWDKIKEVGLGLLVLFVFVGVILLIGLFLKGGVWLSAKVYPWLLLAFSLTLGITLFILIPLAFFQKTRKFSGNSMVISSYVFGLTLWVWGLLLTYTLWGGFAVFVGLFLLGVGVVPIAILATLIGGMWPTLGQLILLTVMTFGARFLGAYLIAKAETSDRYVDAQLST